MGVTGIIDNFKSDETHVFQRAAGTIRHMWWTGSGWNNEVLPDPLRGALIGATFPDQVPAVNVQQNAGGEGINWCFVGAQTSDNRYQLWYQASNSTDWNPLDMEGSYPPQGWPTNSSVNPS
jgi:hypothetical protein